MLEGGADIFIRQHHKGPVWWAAVGGHMEAVQLLVARGADVYVPGHNSLVPDHDYATGDAVTIEAITKIWDWLAGMMEKGARLGAAIQDKNRKLVFQLIREGAPIVMRNRCCCLLGGVGWGRCRAPPRILFNSDRVSFSVGTLVT